MIWRKVILENQKDCQKILFTFMTSLDSTNFENNDLESRFTVN